MMKRYLILSMILAWCFLSMMPVHGQYVTKRLASLARSTGVVISDTLINSEIRDIDSLFFFRKHPLHIKLNNQGEVCHLGYSLFNKNGGKDSLTALYDFLERYLLELDLLSSKERKLRLEMDNVVCLGDPVSMIKAAGENESLKVNYETNHRYLVDWQRDDNHLTMGFDAYYQLLLGANDIELEETLWRKIQRMSSQHEHTDNFKLIFDRYGYVKDTISFRRHDVKVLIEEDCKEVSIHPKSTTEDVLFGINREMGFVHLASFKSDEAKLITYIPIHDAPDGFINQLIPPQSVNEPVIVYSDSLKIEERKSDSLNNRVVNNYWEEELLIRQFVQKIENAIRTKEIGYLDSIWYDMKIISSDDVGGRPRTNRDFLRNIRKILSRQKWIDVRSIPLVRSEGDSVCVYMEPPIIDRDQRLFYGVYFQLQLRSENYFDNNYIFMILEITEKKEILVHLTLLQPEIIVNGRRKVPEKISIKDYIP